MCPSGASKDQLNDEGYLVQYPSFFQPIFGHNISYFFLVVFVQTFFVEKPLFVNLSTYDCRNNHQFELIYVDDGSTDDTLVTLKKIDNSIKTIILKNHLNLAQSQSILNGIDISSNNNIILLDGDLQNDPKDIIKMTEIYEKNGHLTILR